MREAAAANIIPQQVEYAAMSEEAVLQNVKRVCALQVTGATAMSEKAFLQNVKRVSRATYYVL